MRVGPDASSVSMVVQGAVEVLPTRHAPLVPLCDTVSCRPYGQYQGNSPPKMQSIMRDPFKPRDSKLLSGPEGKPLHTFAYREGGS